MDEPGLWLFSRSLLSKHGFNDGDLPDHIWDWAEDHGVAEPEDWHDRLRLLVRRHLLPVLEQDVELVDVETIHNPIRAERVDGAEIDWYADNAGIHLTPESVFVPMAEVLDVVPGEVVVAAPAAGADEDYRQERS